jgi:hypothetical protein
MHDDASRLDQRQPSTDLRKLPMILTVPTPVTISVTGTAFSLLDMARHVTGKDPRFNRTADAARAGARIVAAIAEAKGGTVDLTEPDLRLLAEVVEAPRCGWGAHQINIELPTPQGNVRSIQRNVHAPTAEYLPLIDAVAKAAAALPPLAK